jgi:hypothetical protein
MTPYRPIATAAKASLRTIASIKFLFISGYLNGFENGARNI